MELLTWPLRYARECVAVGDGPVRPIFGRYPSRPHWRLLQRGAGAARGRLSGPSTGRARLVPGRGLSVRHLRGHWRPVRADMLTARFTGIRGWSAVWRSELLSGQVRAVNQTAPTAEIFC